MHSDYRIRVACFDANLATKSSNWFTSQQTLVKMRSPLTPIQTSYSVCTLNMFARIFIQTLNARRKLRVKAHRYCGYSRAQVTSYATFLDFWRRSQPPSKIWPFFCFALIVRSPTWTTFIPTTNTPTTTYTCTRDHNPVTSRLSPSSSDIKTFRKNSRVPI